MKAIVKTWRNRLPIISDDLSHWSEIFTWRQHHYKFIASHYGSEQKANSGTSGSGGASGSGNDQQVRKSCQITHFILNRYDA